MIQLKRFRIPLERYEVQLLVVADTLEPYGRYVKTFITEEDAHDLSFPGWNNIFHELELSWYDLHGKTQCNKCGWLIKNHWTNGVCPKPERELCGSCDAILPMQCTCIDPPKEPIADEL